jgi:hypothetical protein
MAPVALLVSSLVFVVMGVRGDASKLGPLVIWAPSLAQFLAAVALVWIAARESTPARRLPRQLVTAAAGAALFVVALVTLLTYETVAAQGPVRGTVLKWDLRCGLSSTVAGAILVLLFAWMFRNSVATRPTVAGALYGAAAGIAINADWRIVCPVSTFRHALGAHGAAVIATVLLGALIGRLFSSSRQRARRS